MAQYSVNEQTSDIVDGISAIIGSTLRELRVLDCDEGGNVDRTDMRRKDAQRRLETMREVRNKIEDIMYYVT